MRRLDGPARGNDVIRTPNIDAVARAACCSATPSSRPRRVPRAAARCSAGRYFFNTGRGAILHGAVWDGRIPASRCCSATPATTSARSCKVWSPGTPADAPYGGQKYAYQKAGRASTSSRENVTQAVAGGKPLEAAKRDLVDEVQGNFDAFLKAATPKDSRSASGSARRTSTASGSRARARRSGTSTRTRSRGSCRRSCPTCPRCARTSPTTSARPRRSTRRVGVLLRQLEEIGRAGQHARGHQRRPRGARLPARQVQPVRLRRRRLAGRPRAGRARAAAWWTTSST